MPEVNLPLIGPVNASVDQISLRDGESAVFYDGFIDESGGLNKRFGYSSFLDLSTGKSVDGLYWWPKEACVIAVSGGNTYKISSSDNPSASDITGDLMNTGSRVSFANNGSTLFMANGDTGTGNDLYYYSDGGTVVRLADDDLPGDITHVAYLDNYIIVNDGESGLFYYADSAAAPDFGASDFFTAEGAPDDILGLGVAWRELLLFGKNSIESWYNDGASPFARKFMVEVGVSGKNAFVSANNTWYFFSNTRRLMRLDGMTPVVVSSPYDKVYSGLKTVSDCTIDQIGVDGRTFLLIRFPKENQSFVYDFRFDSWSQWSYWDSVAGDRSIFRSNVICYAEDWGKWLMGDYENGIIYELKSSAYDDGGNKIRLQRRTGFIDHNTHKRKRTNSLSFKVKSATGNSSVTEPYMVVSWRNENGVWHNPRTVSLGKSGERQQHKDLYRLGMYRQRQYEITHEGASPFVMSSAQEDIDLMNS